MDVLGGCVCPIFHEFNKDLQWYSERRGRRTPGKKCRQIHAAPCQALQPYGPISQCDLTEPEKSKVIEHMVPGNSLKNAVKELAYP